MPYIYIGRKTLHVGKTLWQILGNLKDFGVGRLITRGTHLRYEEACFYKIVRVFPQFHEPKDEPRKVAVWVERVFRGNKYPEIVQMRHVTYKSDFQLVPKEDEHLFYELAKQKQNQTRKIGNTLPTPPLLKELLIKEAVSLGKIIVEPELKLTMQTSPNNNIQVVENKDAAVQPEYGLGTTRDPCLYNNIDAFFQAKQELKSSPIPSAKV